MDEHGLIPEALREYIARAKAAGERIKFLYTVPTFNNPAGVTLTRNAGPRCWRSPETTTSSFSKTTPGLLYFDSPPPAALRSLSQDGVVYLGTFSKTLAPGFRVGWALAPHWIRDKLILENEAAVLCPSSFTQLIISEYLSTADWKGQIDTFRGVYRTRRDAFLDALGEFLPELTWTVPGGGFYVWLTLPEGLDSKAMLPRAVGELVAYTPGPPSTQTATATGTCACHSAIRSRTSSARASAVSAASSRPSWTCSSAPADRTVPSAPTLDGPPPNLA